MSTTLTMTDMVAKLKRKTGIGLGDPDCVDFINEAFRKLNQMSKGGFVWQFKQTTVTVPPGGQVDIALPSDFDPGKTAILRGDNFWTPTNTIIPYLNMKDFVNQEHFESLTPNVFACWTWIPNFVNPNVFPYKMKLAPAAAYPTVGGTLPFFYHALIGPPVALGANYFPTPDQFDSLIVDLAIAEVRNVYRMSGQQDEVAQAVAAIAQVIDTYRTDRIDLDGLTDQMMTAQAKQAAKDK